MYIHTSIPRFIKYPQAIDVFRLQIFPIYCHSSKIFCYFYKLLWVVNQKPCTAARMSHLILKNILRGKNNQLALVLACHNSQRFIPAKSNESTKNPLFFSKQKKIYIARSHVHIYIFGMTRGYILSTFYTY